MRKTGELAFTVALRVSERKGMLIVSLARPLEDIKIMKSRVVQPEDEQDEDAGGNGTEIANV